MNRLLEDDVTTFVKEYQCAYYFLIGAHQRYEFYCMLLNDKPNEYAIRRMDELSRGPACTEPWFLELLHSDARVQSNYSRKIWKTFNQGKEVSHEN